MPAILIGLVLPAFGAAVLHESAWPVFWWLAVLLLYALIPSRKRRL